MLSVNELVALILSCLLLVVELTQPKPAIPRPQLFTVLVYHDECTECGDFELDSGEVIVPEAMRSRYIDAVLKSPRFGYRGPDRRRRLTEICASRGYHVGNVKLEDEATFDKLFLLPGRTRTDTIRNKAGVVYPWDFSRRYRATVEVTGIKWSYLTVRVRKIVRLSDRKDY